MKLSSNSKMISIVNLLLALIYVISIAIGICIGIAILHKEWWLVIFLLVIGVIMSYIFTDLSKINRGKNMVTERCFIEEIL